MLRIVNNSETRTGRIRTVAVAPEDHDLVTDVPRDRRHSIPNWCHLGVDVVHEPNGLCARRPGESAPRTTVSEVDAVDLFE